MNNITALDWNEYVDTAVAVASEGVVMIKNDNNALPLKKDEKIAIFGRIQLTYYKSGTGSGGMVNVAKIINVTEALIDSEYVDVNTELLQTYKDWIAKNPFDVGKGWGSEPWSQKEMPLSSDFVKKIATQSETAVVIIGRTAGEEMENRDEKGAYRLSDAEEEMLDVVTANFDKVIVLLNVGGIFDMSFVAKYNPASVLYLWQGGMIGGTGAANVLTGKVSPCGKLPDTIAKNIADYPSDKYFGNLVENIYVEDIFVGYRYFETFNKDAVLYPFGYGISYTSFEKKLISFTANDEEAVFEVAVTNTGDYFGKEVVQIYVNAPNGKLGKAAKVLCGFEKTDVLQKGESQTLKVTVRFKDFASFDDLGVTGNLSCFVLEAGDYTFFLGDDVSASVEIAKYTINELIVVEKLSKALPPVISFDRFKAVTENGKTTLIMENIPASEYVEKQHRLDDMPAEIAFTGDKGYKLIDVANGKISMETFVAQLDDTALSELPRAEGMCSPKVTAGTASAFGGVTEKLADFGIPCGCCSDGPSGMRLDSGVKAFAIPNGTLIAATFNKKLIEELFVLLGTEMKANKVDCLLGPGMNIHRHPLNGRNFEYFSEDPFLTGSMAVAELTGFHKVGVTGAIKHFCGNNQESSRHNSDSVISERALREIYLKGFEMAVRDADARTIMTTYGAVNGLWTSSHYDLCTHILRKEWGFTGMVMTDWWANINVRDAGPDKSDLAAMCRAGNDSYMVCADALTHQDNILSSLENGELKRAELQQNAAHICTLLTKLPVLKRFNGENTVPEIINRPAYSDDVDPENIDSFVIGENETISLEHVVGNKGDNYYFAAEMPVLGLYKVTITAKSGKDDSSELAQMPITFYCGSTAIATFTWNGAEREWKSYTCANFMISKNFMMRLYFAEGGLALKDIKFEHIESNGTDLEKLRKQINLIGE